jgi:hypothetical protein
MNASGLDVGLIAGNNHSPKRSGESGPNSRPKSLFAKKYENNKASSAIGTPAAGVP